MSPEDADGMANSIDPVSIAVYPDLSAQVPSPDHY